jgi:hypothetical protein
VAAAAGFLFSKVLIFFLPPKEVTHLVNDELPGLLFLVVIVEDLGSMLSILID